MATGLTTDMAGLRNSLGLHIGYTDWEEMTQERVDRFADITDDHNFIHVDPERARQTPFGGTIAHGFLSLSLLAPVSTKLLKVSDAAMGVDYRAGPGSLSRPAARGRAVARRGRDHRGQRRRGRRAGRLHGDDRGQGPRKPAVVAESLVRIYG